MAMIAIGEKELHPVLLEPCDGKSIEGIRLTFHKMEMEKAFEWAKIIMEKGYRFLCSRWEQSFTAIWSC